MDFFTIILIGGVAGWLAGVFVRGHGHGVLINIILGIIGGVIGAKLLDLFGITFGVGKIAKFFTSFIGAVAVILVVSLFSKR